MELTTNCMTLLRGHTTQQLIEMLCYASYRQRLAFRSRAILLQELQVYHEQPQAKDLEHRVDVLQMVVNDYSAVWDCLWVLLQERIPALITPVVNSNSNRMYHANRVNQEYGETDLFMCSDKHDLDTITGCLRSDLYAGFALKHEDLAQRFLRGQLEEGEALWQRVSNSERPNMESHFLRLRFIHDYLEPLERLVGSHELVENMEIKDRWRIVKRKINLDGEAPRL